MIYQFCKTAVFPRIFRKTEVIVPILEQHVRTTEQYQIAQYLRFLNINTHFDIYNLTFSKTTTRETATTQKWKLKQNQEKVTSPTLHQQKTQHALLAKSTFANSLMANSFLFQQYTLSGSGLRSSSSSVFK